MRHLEQLQENLDAQTRIDTERLVASVQKEIEALEVSKKERDYATKYHMVKFFGQSMKQPWFFYLRDIQTRRKHGARSTNSRRSLLRTRSPAKKGKALKASSCSGASTSTMSWYVTSLSTPEKNNSFPTRTTQSWRNILLCILRRRAKVNLAKASRRKWKTAPYPICAVKKFEHQFLKRWRRASCPPNLKF
jgi:hypothetical protein